MPVLGRGTRHSGGSRRCCDSAIWPATTYGAGARFRCATVTPGNAPTETSWKLRFRKTLCPRGGLCGPPRPAGRRVRPGLAHQPLQPGRRLQRVRARQRHPQARLVQPARSGSSSPASRLGGMYLRASVSIIRSASSPSASCLSLRTREIRHRRVYPPALCPSPAPRFPLSPNQRQPAIA